MKLDPAEIRPTITRLKRVNGHLAHVIRMLEEGADCEEALTQMAAVTRAVNRGGYSLVARAMQQCLEQERSGQEDATDPATLEKLFLTLA